MCLLAQQHQERDQQMGRGMAMRGERFERIQRRVSRRAMVTGTGLAGLGALAGSVPMLRSAAQTTPAVQATIDAASTIEMFSVTLLGVARDRGRRLGLGPADVRFLRATQCEDEAHQHFLEAAGASPATTTFAIANTTFADRDTFYQHLVDVETIAVAGYMAAARAFAAAGNLRLVEIAYQIGAVEAQHQALAKLLLGDLLPSDRAFPAWRFHDMDEAVTALKAMGFIGGPGKKYDYPGPVDRNCRGVFGLVPETTEDQEPAPAASPVSSPQPGATPAQ
jgi:hypothetical protein